MRSGRILDTLDVSAHRSYWWGAVREREKSRMTSQAFGLGCWKEGVVTTEMGKAEEEHVLYFGHVKFKVTKHPR